MEGYSLFCLGSDDGIEKATDYFDKCFAQNPNNIEALLGKLLCHIKSSGISIAAPRVPSSVSLINKKDVQLFRRIVDFYQGKANSADVFLAANNPLAPYTTDDEQRKALSFAHFYVGLYLDCLFRKSGIGLSRASRLQYRLASKAVEDLEQSSLDSRHQLSKRLHAQCESNLHQLYSWKEIVETGKAPRGTFYQPCRLGNTSNLDPGFSTAIVGCWQLSVGHHDHDGTTTQELQSRCCRAISVGHTTFDMGDIYTGVEDFMGRFLELQTEDVRQRAQIHTKLVPDLDLLSEWNERYTSAIVQRSLNRLGLEVLDLVQFHWWDWGRGDHVKAYAGLCRCDRVRRVGVTNYDTEHLRELLDAELPVACNQIQFSLVDRRAAADSLLELCASSNVRVLAYGSLAGGFLSDTWLGKADPVREEQKLQYNKAKKLPSATLLSDSLTNRSLVKYYLIIREFGGWALFQALLKVLRCIANRHGEENIATVAQAWVLAQPAVGAIIIGLSGDRGHAECTKRAYWLAHELTDEDLHQIDSILQQSEGPGGAFYELERQRCGPHGTIMRYNCGQLHTDAHVKEFCLRVDRFMESGKTRCDTAVSRRRTSIWKGLRMEARQFPISCQQGLIAGSTHVAEMFEVET